MAADIAEIRRDYKLKSLMENEVSPDAISQFESWFNEAVTSQIDEVNAMALATCTKQGLPSARIVLLKGVNADGFMFFTNYQSHKARELEENPQAALVFFWKELERQVRIEGSIEKISAKESDTYFNSRPANSRIGAWASPQSQPISDRQWIEKSFLQYSEDFKEGAIPRPAHWGGYLVKPTLIEFWQGRSSRLHDRLQYTKQQNGWKIERLAP